MNNGILRVDGSNFTRSRRRARFLPCLGACLLAAILSWLAEPLCAHSPAAAQAMAAQQQGNFAEAEKDWHAVVAQNPQDAIAYANLGFVLAHQNKYSEAVPAYRKAARLNPTMPGIQLNWRIAEFKQGHFEEGIRPLSAA